MHLVSQQPQQPIESPSDLYDYFVRGAKPKSDWRLGTEIELIGVSTDMADFGDAIPYGGGRGIGAVLQELSASGWTPVQEGEHIIALAQGGAQITIEPGGQLELATRPVECAQDTERDFIRFANQLQAPSHRFAVAWLGVGFRPFGLADDVSWMPKGRYDVMRAYLPTRGRLAHEMMKRTATVQTNIDYSDVHDAAEKLRCAMSVTTILTAVYANSPIVDEAAVPWQSYRSAVWHETDPDRCGLLRFAFDGGDIFEAYVHWALDVPMFFVYRKEYIPANGLTFRRFLNEGFQGHRATIEDWALHLSTLFPETRMKRLIEIRGCDAGSLEMALALGPLCRGLLYDTVARQQATQLTQSLTFSQRMEFAREVAQKGLRARVPGQTFCAGDLAKELVAIAQDGLLRQAPGEIGYLDPPLEIVTEQRTQADALAERWQSTSGDREEVVRFLAHAGLGANEGHLS